MFKNWKTTLIGVLSAIVAGISTAHPEWSSVTTPLLALITALLGLLAKDASSKY